MTERMWLIKTLTTACVPLHGLTKTSLEQMPMDDLRELYSWFVEFLDYDKEEPTK